MFEATCPRLVPMSPASTGERRVKNAEPMQISRLVRTPADLCLSSRSNPMRPPSPHASNSRWMAPLAITICSSQLKLKACANCVRAVVIGCFLERCYHLVFAGVVDSCAGSIGDVKRDRGLAGRGEAPIDTQAGGMSVHGLVNIVAIESQD